MPLSDDAALRALLEACRSIAVLGIKAGESDDAYRVPAYLQRAGYRILPVSPKLTSVLGEPCVARLADLAQPADLIDVFRASAHIPAHADEILALPWKPRGVWLQEGIRDDASAARIWALAGVLGAALGPAAGGILTQLLGWESIFLVQVPLLLVALLALRGAVAPRIPEPAERPHIAANLALCGMLAALFNRAFPGAGVLPVLVLSLLAGGLLGAFNGLLVWKLRLPPIVVTLGTMSVYRGVIFLLSKGAWVNENEMTREFVAFPRAGFLGLTVLTWLALLLVAGFIVALRGSRLARDLYAAGGNPHAAEYSGIDAGRAQFIAYTICGAIAGVCGYLWVARFAVAYTDIALGFELQVIAACLIGGVAITGGVGSALGVLLGCLFIGIIRSSLPLVGVSAFWQMFINGVVILVAVLLGMRARGQRRATLEPSSRAA